MKSFNSCKSLYKRIAKWEKLDKKIRFMWSQYKLQYMDFDERELIYEWVRKQDRRLHIYHIDRRKWDMVLLVTIEDINWWYIDGFWPCKKMHKELVEKLEWIKDVSKFLFTKIKKWKQN